MLVFLIPRDDKVGPVVPAPLNGVCWVAMVRNRSGNGDRVFLYLVPDPVVKGRELNDEALRGVNRDDVVGLGGMSLVRCLAPNVVENKDLIDQVNT